PAAPVQRQCNGVLAAEVHAVALPTLHLLALPERVGVEAAHRVGGHHHVPRVVVELAFLDVRRAAEVCEQLVARRGGLAPRRAAGIQRGAKRAAAAAPSARSASARYGAGSSASISVSA